MLGKKRVLTFSLFCVASSLECFLTCSPNAAACGASRCSAQSCSVASKNKNFGSFGSESCEDIDHCIYVEFQAEGDLVSTPAGCRSKIILSSLASDFTDIPFWDLSADPAVNVYTCEGEACNTPNLGSCQDIKQTQNSGNNCAARNTGNDDSVLREIFLANLVRDQSAQDVVESFAQSCVLEPFTPDPDDPGIKCELCEALGTCDANGVLIDVTEQTNSPTHRPSTFPSQDPTKLPTAFPSRNPTKLPTAFPSRNPTKLPTSFPSQNPTKTPTLFPSESDTRKPTTSPTPSPQANPTGSPQETEAPTSSPSEKSSNPDDTLVIAVGSSGGAAVFVLFVVGCFVLRRNHTVVVEDKEKSKDILEPRANPQSFQRVINVSQSSRNMNPNISTERSLSNRDYELIVLDLEAEQDVKVLDDDDDAEHDVAFAAIVASM